MYKSATHIHAQFLRAAIEFYSKSSSSREARKSVAYLCAQAREGTSLWRLPLSSAHWMFASLALLVISCHAPYALTSAPWGHICTLAAEAAAAACPALAVYYRTCRSFALLLITHMCTQA